MLTTRSSRYFLRLDADEGAKISTLNKVYDRNKHLKDVDFLNGILDDLKIKFEIPEEDLNDYQKKVLTLRFQTIRWVALTVFYY
jgi:hypothetical protein